jgi:hypothetical protein
MNKYIRPTRKEISLLMIFAGFLSVMFSILLKRFLLENYNLLSLLTIFFIFIYFLLYLRLLFMKRSAYHLGIELNLKAQYFDQYWYKNRHRVTKYIPGVQKGIFVPFVSSIIYILTLGIVIFPAFWYYETKIIPHKHIGTRSFFEGFLPIIGFKEVSEYRYSRALFSGFIFYVVAALLIKFIFGFENDFSIAFIFIIFYMAIISLIPIPRTEGLDLFFKNLFAWHSALAIIFSSLIFVVFLRDLMYLIMFVGLLSAILIFYIFWRRIMK